MSSAGVCDTEMSSVIFKPRPAKHGLDLIVSNQQIPSSSGESSVAYFPIQQVKIYVFWVKQLFACYCFRLNTWVLTRTAASTFGDCPNLQLDIFAEFNWTCSCTGWTSFLGLLFFSLTLEFDVFHIFLIVVQFFVAAVMVEVFVSVHYILPLFGSFSIFLWLLRIKKILTCLGFKSPFFVSAPVSRKYPIQ